MSGIVCKNCGHQKHWHRDEGRCRVQFSMVCDCEAWDYGTFLSDGDEAALVGDTDDE